MRINPYPKDLATVVVIPYWVAEAVSRNRLTIGECLDYEKIKGVLSLEDMGAFYNAQDLLSEFVGAKSNDIMQFGTRLGGYWNLSIPLDNVALKKDWTDRSTLFEAIGKDVASRLMGEDLKLDRYPEPFKVVDLANRVAGLIVYPGHFVGTVDPGLQFELVDALLKVFYMYSPYHDVAKSPLFKRHLELLAGPYSHQ